jgi:hypothetical protein
MVHTSPSTAVPNLSENLQPAIDWTTAFTDTLMQVQRFQIEAFTSWQQSIAAVNKELWDEWTAHWGGGIPIDG